MTKNQLTKLISDAVSTALAKVSSIKEGRTSTRGTDDRNSNIRAAIRSGKSKSAVRRQYKLSDYQYRGHKAFVTRMANSNN